MLEVYVRFGAEIFYAFEKAEIALISATWRRGAFDVAQLIKIMQLLERRHPESRMRVELLIKRGRSALVGANAQEIGSCTIGMGPVPVLMSIVAVATVDWPNPFHGLLFFLPVLKKHDSVRQPNQASTRDRDRPPTAR